MNNNSENDNNIPKENLNLSSKSEKGKKNEEQKEFKKSSTYNMGEGAILIKMKNFNDISNNNSPYVKKSKSFKEININRLNLPYRINNNGGYHLDTVLETINEVSNSIVDSSELSDDDEEEENNEENNANNNNNVKCLNYDSNKKKERETISDSKKNDSEYNANTATKNTLNLL